MEEPPPSIQIEEYYDDHFRPIDALQKRAADLKSSFDQSRQETNEQVKARLNHAKADIAARQSAVKEEPSRPPAAPKANGNR